MCRGFFYKTTEIALKKKDRSVERLVREGDLIDLRNTIGPRQKAMEPCVAESGKQFRHLPYVLLTTLSYFRSTYSPL